MRSRFMRFIIIMLGAYIIIRYVKQQKPAEIIPGSDMKPAEHRVQEGAEEKINEQPFVRVSCPACDGTGKSLFGRSGKNCDFCNGLGNKVVSRLKLKDNQICPQCSGFGRILLVLEHNQRPVGYNHCPKCGGKGLIKK
jgi:DnaJ-class molecular chaperone